MTYTLVRPSSLPYSGTAYASLLNFTPEPFTTGGNGSLADDSDGTYVNAASEFIGAQERATLIAVDFPPVDLVSEFYGTMFQVARLVEGWMLNNSRWNVFATGDPSTILSYGDMHDALSPSNPSSIPTTPTTITTGNDWYGNAVSSGMTLVFSASSNAETLTDIYRIFECGLLLDIGGAPPLQQRPAPPARLSGRMDGAFNGARRLNTSGPSRQTGFHPGSYY